MTDMETLHGLRDGWTALEFLCNLDCIEFGRLDWYSCYTIQDFGRVWT
jgi:hypothetical protein